MNPWVGGYRVARYRAFRYVPGGLLWVANHSSPLLVGLLLKAIFDRVSQGGSAAHGALPLLAILAGVELGRAAIFWSAAAAWPGWTQGIAAWLRGNLLDSVLCAPGSPSQRLPGSPGEAVGRFRDDVEDLMWFVDVWVDVVGGLVFTAIALAIMLSISWTITLVVILPLVAVAAATQTISQRIRRYHRSMRQSGSSVTSFVGELFAGTLALKTAGAEARTLDRFRARNAERADAAVKAWLCRDLLFSVSGASTDISIGLVLLLAAPAMRNGTFTVGDLALFTSYAVWLTGLPRWTGRMLGKQREAAVALDRLGRIDANGTPDGVLKPSPVHFRVPPPPAPVPDKTADDRLDQLTVRGLTARYGSSGRGVVGVDLDVTAGSFTVVTGAVGAGKSTLVRALLGLVPAESGAIAWNGAPVDDPSTELVPPRVAYAGQTARLFSASFDENVRLGWTPSPEWMAESLRLAQLDGDVRALPAGIQTAIGPRGGHLSGGQAQRTAVVRALVRAPELLVVDDPSSALDLATEARLWDGLAAAGITVLAVSHRRSALARADHVVVLDRGRVVGAGPATELLRDCAEFRRLWQGEAVDEAEDAVADVR